MELNGQQKSKTDCCFCVGRDWFRYRVGAIIISDDHALFAYGEDSGYYYTVGGGVHIGERSDEAVIREVQEETGINDLESRGLICITDHCYRRDGKWHLKHTWWYDMLHTSPTDLTPQKEEDIFVAAWVAKSSLPPFLTNTYPSIAEVFREAKI
jgi:ADP-ribose pyrophosphatase YjhB (NUDIX family)